MANITRFSNYSAIRFRDAAHWTGEMPHDEWDDYSEPYEEPDDPDDWQSEADE